MLSLLDYTGDILTHAFNQVAAQMAADEDAKFLREFNKISWEKADKYKGNVMRFWGNNSYIWRRTCFFTLAMRYNHPERLR